MGSNLDLLQEEDVRQKETTVPLSTVQNDNSVFIGEALDEDDKLNLLMTDAKPYITVLVGFEGYGKTSFVATCYHILLTDGGIGEYKFFDSDTLVGLERRSFLRRYNKIMEDVAPATKRTIRGEAHLLTFHFSKEGKEKVTIFSDHSGEDYREYADKKGKIENDILIQNADRILFFIDVPMLLGKGYLQMFQYYKNLLNNMRDARIFRPQIKVCILFNKIDTISADDTERYEKKKQAILPTFRNLVGQQNIEIIDLISNDIQNSDHLKQLLEDVVKSESCQNWNDMGEVNLDWVKQFIKDH